MVSTIDWCFDQESVMIVEPDPELMSAFLDKARNALSAMQAVRGNKEWEASTAYYAMYYAAYALLMKIGVQSRIHKCTIEICKVFFRDLLSSHELRLFEDACCLRNKIQYHIVKEGYPEDLNTVVAAATPFVGSCGRLCKLDLNDIRKRLCNAFLGKRLQRTQNR